MRVAVLAASVWGPGLAGWDLSCPVLAGAAPYDPVFPPPPPPALLPANERRRTGPVVRLALAVAGEAAAACGIAPTLLRSVFASANGDGPVVGGILEALSAGGAAEGRLVSPTQFGNSVHNGAAGYWSIATGGAQPAGCLGCGDATWAAALLAAAAEVHAAGAPVLLVAYDHPLPPPLHAKRPILAPFAAALVLAPPDQPGWAQLEVEYQAAPARPDEVEPALPGLRALALGNPAGQSLRLLEHLARGESGACPAPYLAGHLRVGVLA